MKQWMNKITTFIITIIIFTAFFASCSKLETKKIKLDYSDATLFENDLNNGKDLTGKTTKVNVVDFYPNSQWGYNIWAGEHLNFVSEKHPHVQVGDVLYVKVTDISSVMGSYIIKYEKIDPSNIEIEETIEAKNEDKIEKQSDIDNTSSIVIDEMTITYPKGCLATISEIEDNGKIGEIVSGDNGGVVFSKSNSLVENFMFLFLRYPEYITKYDITLDLDDLSKFYLSTLVGVLKVLEKEKITDYKIANLQSDSRNYFSVTFKDGEETGQAFIIATDYFVYFGWFIDSNFASQIINSIKIDDNWSKDPIAEKEYLKNTNWLVKTYVDEFNLHTEEWYIYNINKFKCIYDDSITSRGTKYVQVLIDKNSAAFKFFIWEKDSTASKNIFNYTKNYIVKFRKQNGDIVQHSATWRGNDDRMYLDNIGYLDLIATLTNNESINVYIEDTNTNEETYTFEITPSNFPRIAVLLYKEINNQ